MSKILVVDDNPENLVAARLAAESFPEHEFVFTNSAKEAVAWLEGVDIVITDLFFPDENHEGDENNHHLGNRDHHNHRGGDHQQTPA